MIDLVTIKVMAGCGGDGAVSFFKLKNMRYGKPDGGDGGKGGSVFIESMEQVFDLEEYRGKKIWQAEDGENGGKNNKTGKEGKGLVLPVPAGTMVTIKGMSAEVGQPNFFGSAILSRNKVDTIHNLGTRSQKRTQKNCLTSPQTFIFDFNQPGQKILVTEGGRGGKGNSHARFKQDKKGKRGEHWDSFNRAQKGEKGEEKEVTLELKYLAQVGIIGLPNVGKSTLLSVITSAHPKIADYPFTTLEPNLGVMRTDVYYSSSEARSSRPAKRGSNNKNSSHSIVIADIPGLIEGASKGRGLGFLFLRHIERTGLLIHVLDANAKDLAADYQTIRNELKLYGKDLEKKRELIAINKTDLTGEEQINKIKSLFKRKKIFLISALEKQGVEELVRNIVKLTSKGGE